LLRFHLILFSSYRQLQALPRGHPIKAAHRENPKEEGRREADRVAANPRPKQVRLLHAFSKMFE